MRMYQLHTLCTQQCCSRPASNRLSQYCTQATVWGLETVRSTSSRVDVTSLGVHGLLPTISLCSAELPACFVSLGPELASSEQVHDGTVAARGSTSVNTYHRQVVWIVQLALGWGQVADARLAYPLGQEDRRRQRGAIMHWYEGEPSRYASMSKI